MIEEIITVRPPPELFHEFLQWQLRKRKWPRYRRKKFLKKIYKLVLEPDVLNTEILIAVPKDESWEYLPPKRKFCLTDIWSMDYGYRERFYILTDFYGKILFYEFFLEQLRLFNLVEEEKATAKLFLNHWALGKEQELDDEVKEVAKILLQQYA